MLGLTFNLIKVKNTGSEQIGTHDFMSEYNYFQIQFSSQCQRSRYAILENLCESRAFRYNQPN